MNAVKRRLSVVMPFVAALCFSIALAQPAPSTEPPWDLRNTAQAGLFVFYDAPAGASSTGKPLDIGDFDGNGCGDLAITGQNDSPLGRGAAGHIRVVMNLCNIGGQMAMDAVEPGQGVFSIYGARPGDMAGTETHVADFNNDGFADLLFGAQNSDGAERNRPNAGAAYVWFGSPQIASRGDIDLLQPPDEVMTFYGATREDRFGLWVAGGDFDDDGFDDLLVSANQADGEDDHRINAGEAWIIFGASDMIARYGQVTDMEQPPADATRIIGADYDDLLGSCLWGDDLNGDGYADAIVSAALWRASSGLGGLSFGGGDGPGNRRYNSGETFVVFGAPDLRGQTVDLAARIDQTGHPIDDSLTVIYGPGANDLLGEEIAAGDIDGDGRLDLLVGTLIGAGPENNQPEAGEAWVIYTREPFAGQMIDLASPEAGRAVVIYPGQPDSKAGDTLRAADLDQDGSDDVFYGAPNYDPVGLDGRARPDAGMLAVIFGRSGGLPSNNGRILLSEPPEGLRVRYIVGADDNDMMAYAMAVFDVDGDGYVDIAPNAMGGDGARNNQINAGEIYVISGAEFLSPDHVYGEGGAPQATVTPWPTATPAPQATVTASQVGDRERGQKYYSETCFACHGLQGEGVSGLGLPLVTSPLVMYAPDNELLAFLRSGRPSDHPENTTGVSMPPSGGRPDWSDQQLLDIIAYLRWLRDQRR